MQSDLLRASIPKEGKEHLRLAASNEGAADAQAEIEHRKSGAVEDAPTCQFADELGEGEKQK